MTEADVPLPSELAAQAAMHDAARAIAEAQIEIETEARAGTGSVDLLLWERLRAAYLEADAAIVRKHIAETEAKMMRARSRFLREAVDRREAAATRREAGE